MKNLRILNVIVHEDATACLTEIYRLIHDSQCNVMETRMTSLASETAIIIMLEGKWDRLAIFEKALERGKSELNIDYRLLHTTARKYKPGLVSYTVEAVSFHKPGVAFLICDFFNKRQIQIQEADSSNYLSAPSNTPMGILRLSILLPYDTSIAELRDSFLQYCENHNIDGALEPDKG